MSCDERHCITCSDEGIAMSVVAVDERRGIALCIDDSGAKHSVETDLVAPVALGDSVLVHAAVALVRLEETAAA
jgi:hydrogenase maturation factor